MADIIIIGLAPETFSSQYMGVYEWQEEHSGGERPVYKLKDDDDIYLYYYDSEGKWIVANKDKMLGRKGVGVMKVEDKALTPGNITATWDIRGTGSDWAVQAPEGVQAPEVSVCCSRCCAFVTQSSSFCVSDSCAASHNRQHKGTGTAEGGGRAACKAAGRGARQHHDGWSSGRACVL